MSEESYSPSQTPESESVTTDYGSSDRSSSYFDSVSDSQTSIMTISESSQSSSLSE